MVFLCFVITFCIARESDASVVKAEITLFPSVFSVFFPHANFEFFSVLADAADAAVSSLKSAACVSLNFCLLAAIWLKRNFLNADSISAEVGA
jgi:hypothetical protein